jgi:hypothetical protein
MVWKRGLGKTDAETVVVNAKPVYDHVTKTRIPLQSTE